MIETSPNTETESLPVLHASLLEEDLPEKQWLVENLWPLSGVGLIGGHPKSCKSWLGLELALSVASGTPCLDSFSVKEPGTSLIFMAEDTLPVVKKRLQALSCVRGIALENTDLRVITIPRLRLDRDKDRKLLDNTLALHGPRFLLLDPLVRLHNSDENNAQEIAALLAGLRELQRKHNTAIALVHHARKNSSKRHHGQNLRGSSDIFAWADVLHFLSKESSGLKLTMEHRTAPAPEPIFLKLEQEPPHLVIIAENRIPEPSMQERILATLNRTDKPLKRTELRTLLSVNNKRLGDSLATLEILGKIKRTKSGWHL